MDKHITAPTWAEINLDNIKYNLKNIKNILKEDTKICGVVKANAYGHGAVQISKLLEREKVDYLAVSRLEEGLELRQNNINIPILCLGYIPECALEEAVANDISLTVFSYETALFIDELSKKHEKISKVHIKIDTGMGRIGFQVNEDSINEISKIDKLENINIEGIYTHFATADEKDKGYMLNQVNKYNIVIKKLDEIGIDIPIKHVSNSAATMECNDLNFNMVRCGIILYGHYPSDEVNKDIIKLKPAMTLKTRIAHIKELEKDSGISYGIKYITNSKEKIATIPIGYADGFTRMQKNPRVYIKGEEFDVVGRICMDQCMVKIDKDIDIKVDDEVIIFSENENQCIEKIADDLGTINYEILCMISRRVERVYMEGNVIVQQYNYLVK
ncbi:MAG: alanine racemase [Paeniclostridium sordellii]|uniref:Alanine racemase n=1 Tax=Paeniclostridium hominis TaxID=2764329 RepID=A0ABR7K712_9FIRM|nr:MULTISPECIES: alanine racemase [Paeniclostridium]MBC6004802.1 alanine racemase [Paeniclostridium hominis]MDU2592221.1 alanine racemase [Paeniclostridium sordellii]